MMKKLSIGFIGASLVMGLGAIAFQSHQTIFSFLLNFYLMPLLLYSIGISMIQFSKNIKIKPIIIGSAVFTLTYTVIYFMNFIDFDSLLSATSSEIASAGNINMSLSSVLTTYITVFMTTVVCRSMVQKIHYFSLK